MEIVVEKEEEEEEEEEGEEGDGEEGKKKKFRIEAPPFSLDPAGRRIK